MNERTDLLNDLADKAERLLATLEAPTLVAKSTKNANAGFIDLRDWYALQADVYSLRSAVERAKEAR